jgi:hypothetical protein
MFSLVAFAIIGVFFLLVWFSAWLCRKIALSAGAGQITARIAAIFGASIVVLPVFWDVPPTLIAHRYYCATDAGVQVYKSPHQWYAEKTGKVALMPPRLLESDEEVRRSAVPKSEHTLRSQGLLVALSQMNVFMSVKLHRSRIVDMHSGEVLVEKRDYSAFFDDFKQPWLVQGRCKNLENKFPNFKQISEEFESIGSMVNSS